MAGKIQRVKRNHDDEDITGAIDNADLWVLITVTATKEGASVSVRESVGDATIDTIAMLLEQPEIYKLVQKKIAQVRMKEDKDKPSTNTNIN